MINGRINPVSSNKRELKNIKQMIEEANGLMKDTDAKMPNFSLKSAPSFYKYFEDLTK